MRARLHAEGPSDVWLGPIRGLCELSDGRWVFLDGESGHLFSFSEEGGLDDLGSAFPPGLGGPVLGTGMHLVR